MTNLEADQLRALMSEATKKAMEDGVPLKDVAIEHNGRTFRLRPDAIYGFLEIVEAHGLVYPRSPTTGNSDEP